MTLKSLKTKAEKEFRKKFELTGSAISEYIKNGVSVGYNLKPIELFFLKYLDLAFQLGQEEERKYICKEIEKMKVTTTLSYGQMNSDIDMIIKFIKNLK